MFKFISYQMYLHFIMIFTSVKCHISWIICIQDVSCFRHPNLGWIELTNHMISDYPNNIIYYNFSKLLINHFGIHDWMVFILDWICHTWIIIQRTAVYRFLSRTSGDTTHITVNFWNIKCYIIEGITQQIKLI
jgi:hypothetical protein